MLLHGPVRLSWRPAASIYQLRALSSVRFLTAGRRRHLLGGPDRASLSGLGACPDQAPAGRVWPRKADPRTPHYKLDFKDNFYKRIVFTGLNTFALKQFNNYIAISDTFKSMLVERGFNKDQIYTVYNGIDIEQKIDYVSKEEFLARFNIDSGDKTIVGIIARLDQVKDHETFIRGAKKVLETRDDVLFLIAGNGNEEDRLKELVKELRLENSIKFLGFITDQYSFLNAIDINALTSLSESFPYAILEGALMKKPIVSTSVGGLNKLVEQGKNGYLVPVGGIDEFAAKIDELADDRDLIREMGENLYKKVASNYSSDNMAREHVKIYEKVIGNK